MKIFIVFLITSLLVFMPCSQGIILEKNNYIEIENKNTTITFFKDKPLMEFTTNGSFYSFYVSSVFFGDGIHIKFRNIIWEVNFTKLTNGIYDFKLNSHVYGYEFNIEYVLLNGQKYMNYSGNGILIHIYINGNPSPSLIIFEHISKGRMDIMGAESHDNFNMYEKSKKLGMNSINYYSKNSTFYVSNKNSTETDLYEIYPYQNGTVQSFSFISIGSVQKTNIFNAEVIIFALIGSIVGIIIILGGVIYQRKKG